LCEGLEHRRTPCGIDARAGIALGVGLVQSIGQVRDECLNEHLFNTLRHAHRMIAAWRSDYNHERPHSSLDGLTPKEYATRSQEDQNLNRTNF